MQQKQINKEAAVIPLQPPTVANDTVNYIPEEAIRISEIERRQKSSVDAPRPDEYNESRVSPTEPTLEEVKTSPADRTVMPG